MLTDSEVKRCCLRRKESDTGMGLLRWESGNVAPGWRGLRVRGLTELSSVQIGPIASLMAAAVGAAKV